jgi:hypothetical protein
VNRRDVLKRIRIASPCPVPWEVMYGDEKVRFCQRCRSHVYDFSAMTSAEVQERLAKIETRTRTCITFFQRSDGTMLTADCRWSRAQRLRRRLTRLTAGLVCFFGLGTVVTTLFGENMRQLFGSSACGIAPGTTFAPPSAGPPKHSLSARLKALNGDMDNYRAR